MTPTDLPALPDGTTAIDSEKWTHPDNWKYDWLPYRGDRLAVRIPNRPAIHAMSNLRHSSDEFKDELSYRFIEKHVSPASYERINSRMVDPDDVEYATCPADTTPLFEVVGELMRLGNERLAESAKALKDVQS